jgi:hypothetical protein
VFGITRWRKTTRTLSLSLVLAMTVSLWGCGGSAPAAVPPEAIVPKSKPAPTKISGKISEVSPPEVIQQLREVLDRYQPQMAIVEPRSNQVLEDNTVSVKLQVKDLPIFKDAKLGLGPHVHLFLDDQPYQAVYDVSQPVVLKDLTPGTHTLRAFASRPWHESFKNEGAYAQTTFHVFTKTPNHNPDPAQPLLTYSRPQGSYGAEPIMLDFYLTNAPLHFVAQEDKNDEVEDWRIRVTINGSSFVLDRWQPIYLKGFEPGKNWVQLEYIDENGNSIQNVYNNIARLFTYEPGGSDTLSKLVRGDLPFDAARSIVDPNYKVDSSYKQSEPSPQPAVIKPLAPEPSPSITPEPKPAPSPLVPVIPAPEAKGKLPSEPQPLDLKDKQEAETSKGTSPSESKPREIKPSDKPKGGFFNRPRPSAEKPAPDVIPSPVPSQVPEVLKAKESEPQTPEVKVPKPEVPAAKVPEVKAPEVKETPKASPFSRSTSPKSPDALKAKQTEAEKPKVKVSAPEVKTPVGSEPEVKTPEVKETPKEGFFNRFNRRRSATPTPTLSPVPPSEPAKSIEVAPKAVPTPDSVIKPFDRSPTSPEPTPKDSSGAPPKVKDLQTTETKIPELAPPKPQETPKAAIPDSLDTTRDRFRRSVSPPTTAPSSAPQEVTPAAKSKDNPPDVLAPSEAPVKVLEPAAPSSQPKKSFLDRFRRSATVPKVAPSVTPSPQLPTPRPREEQEAREIRRAEPTQAPIESKGNSARDNQDNLVDRLRRSPATPKPTPLTTPSTAPRVAPLPTVEQKEPLIEKKIPKPSESSAPVSKKPASLEKSTAQPPKSEPSVPKPSAATDFQPQTELERRLGIPLKPRSETTLEKPASESTPVPTAQ